MRTVSYFKYKGRKVHIYKYAQLSPKGGYVFRAAVDGEEWSVTWPDARELELAIKKVLDED